MSVVTFPVKLCAMCCGRATQSIDLVDEYGMPHGQKHMCDNYPFCDDDDEDAIVTPADRAESKIGQP